MSARSITDGRTEKMDSDKAMISKLKAILKYLDLSTKGNKSELLKRLYEHDSSDS